MFKGVRVVNRRPLSSYICNSCRRQFDAQTGPPLPGLRQQRWISQNYLRKMVTAEEEWQERASTIATGEKMSMLEFLESRGYINQIVGDRKELDNLLTHRRAGIYCGVDPTAPSLHVGHMVPFMVLGWMYVHGYSIHYLLGGATAKVGDPSGRTKQRDVVREKTQRLNSASMHVQLGKLGEMMHRYAERRGWSREWAWRRQLTNNTAWYQKLQLLEFLEVIGRSARIGPMLGRETVRNRVKDGGGMSFAEFTYPLMQAYDWWQLYQRGMQLQVGGADQFGNILAGAEMIKSICKTQPGVDVETMYFPRPRQAEKNKNPHGVSNDPMGFTTPLLTTTSGEKFGKSAGNAIWLDPEMTSSFDLYQFFLRQADADVERYLKLLTFVPSAEIDSVMQEHTQDESKRVAQHRLAKEFVELVHGLAAAEQAAMEHRAVFKKDLSLADIKAMRGNSTSTQAENISGDINPLLNKHAAPPRLEENLSTRLKLPSSLVHGQPLSRILWHAGLVASRSEGQRLMSNRGVSIGAAAGGGKVVPMGDQLSFHPATQKRADELENFIVDEILVLKIGKWKVRIIDIVSDEVYAASGFSCPGWGEKIEPEDAFETKGQQD